MGRKLFFIIILAALAGGAVFYFSSGREQRSGPGRQQPVVGVKIGTVERRDLVDLRVFNGSLSAEKQFDAAFKIGGRIREIAVQLGDCVGRGSLIARLDSEEYEQQQAEARAELDVALASLDEARSSLVAADRSYQRALKLRDQKVAAAAELETAETERLASEAGVNLAQAQIKQRQAALRAAEVRLSYTTLTADWQNGNDDGCRYVARRLVDEGDTVGANAPVVTLVDLSRLKAVINVTERDYALLQVNQPALVSVDFIGARTFPGTVLRMAPIFEETSRQARVEISVDNPDGVLKAGMFAQVHVQMSRADQVPAAPVTAIAQRLGTKGVFVVTMDTVRFVEVQPGIEQDGWVQVDGLEIGQQVVTLGQHLLSDGVRITTADAERPTPAGPGSGGKRPSP